MTALFELACAAARTLSREVGYREDGALLMALGALPQVSGQPRGLHFHPLKSQDPQAALSLLESLRQSFPGLPIHGYSPGWLTRHQAQPRGVDSLALFTGPLQGTEPASEGWEELLDLELPKVASLTYGPQDGEEHLAARLRRLVDSPGLRTVVLLPRVQGDRVLVAGATTDGAQDMAFLARARLSLPAHVRVRASWAALGWKMAQAALCFGADELGGWGLEEQLAYSGRGRPASVVEAAEALAGIREAAKEPLEVV